MNFLHIAYTYFCVIVISDQFWDGQKLSEGFLDEQSERK